MKKTQSLLTFSRSSVAEFRLKVIEFHNRHGTSATIDAYEVGRRSIFRWKRTLKTSGGRLESLVPDSRAPHRARIMTTHFKIIEYIRDLREKHSRIGKEKIKPLLDEYCREENIPTISISTIGKVIKRHNFYIKKGRIYHNPSSKYAQRKVRYRTKVKYSPKVDQMGYVEIDTIVKFIDGIKAYIFNAVDVKGKFQFSYGYTSLTSRNALDFFRKLEVVYPLRDGVKIVQTDNGLEFMGEFDNYLKVKNIKHLFIYPRCPKINAYVERANRTLNEEFLEGNLEYVLDGIEIFNQRLIEYLIWYNTKRVHKTLGNVSPINYLLSVLHKECQMYVTHTIIEFYPFF